MVKTYVAFWNFHRYVGLERARPCRLEAAVKSMAGKPFVQLSFRGRTNWMRLIRRAMRGALSAALPTPRFPGEHDISLSPPIFDVPLPSLPHFCGVADAPAARAEQPPRGHVKTWTRRDRRSLRVSLTVHPE